MNLEKLIKATLDASIEAKVAFWRDQKGPFLDVAELLTETVRQKKKVLIFGNGGSACDALHFAGEWVNRYIRDREGLACIALNADTPLITCIANDYGYEHIFERQVLALGHEGDVAVGLSTSGNSGNVILGLKAAQKKGLKTVAMLGGTGGKIMAEKIFDHALHVASSKDTPRIQEVHEWVLHSLCEAVDYNLLGLDPARASST